MGNKIKYISMAYRKANSPFPQSSDPFSDQGCTLNDIIKNYIYLLHIIISIIYQQSKRDDADYNEPEPVEVDGIDWIHS